MNGMDNMGRWGCVSASNVIKLHFGREKSKYSGLILLLPTPPPMTVIWARANEHVRFGTISDVIAATLSQQ